MKVVIIGASGVVGVALQKELATHGHQLRCVDLGPPRYEMADLLDLFGYDRDVPEAEWIYRDILGEGAAEEIVTDMDACVYVALTEAPGVQPQFVVNAAAPFLVARACLRAGVRKYVHASSVSVHLVQGQTVTEQDSAQCWSEYAMSKWLAEQMLRHYAEEQGLNAICLRVGTVRPHYRVWEGATPHFRVSEASSSYAQIWVDVRDVARAFRLAVEDTKSRFEVLHVVSEGEPVWCSTARAKEVLGYQAQYNGPAHFEALRQRAVEFVEKHGSPKGMPSTR